MPAVKPHKTATDDGPWDGPAQEKKIKTPVTTAVGNGAYAWRDPDADQTTKAAWRFIHHFVANTGQPGAASTLACSTGIGVLNGARVGTTIPDADRKGVYNHLVAHLRDAGVKEADLPELKSAAVLVEERDAAANDDDAPDEAEPCPTCDGSGKIRGGNVTCPDCGGSGDAADAEANSAPKLTPVQVGRARLYGSERLYRSEMRAAEHRCIRQQDPNRQVAQPFEVREVPNGTGGTALRFSGYASIVEKPYEMSDMFGAFNEEIARGAFQKTLNDKADVNFLCNHEGVTMARTKSGSLELSSDATGLYTEARLNLDRSDVQIVRSAVADGDLDEMSFAFRVTRQEWDEDYENRRIVEVNLHQGDVSVVNFGANPNTAGTVALRSHGYDDSELFRSWFAELADLRDAFAVYRGDRGLAMHASEMWVDLNEYRAGATLSAATTKVLTSILDMASTADENVDHIQAVLANLLGVTNPDIEQDAGMNKADSSANEPPTKANGTNDAPTMQSNSALLYLPDYTRDARVRLAAKRNRKGVTT